MIKTVEAIIDEQGNVRLLEPIRLGEARRALVTILEAPKHSRSESEQSKHSDFHRQVTGEIRTTASSGRAERGAAEARRFGGNEYYFSRYEQ